MSTSNNLQHTMKKLIRLELEKCRSDLWPNVCEMIATKKGYHRIEARILRHAANEGMPIGSAIALIEQEFAHAQD